MIDLGDIIWICGLHLFLQQGGGGVHWSYWRKLVYFGDRSYWKKLVYFGPWSYWSKLVCFGLQRYIYTLKSEPNCHEPTEGYWYIRCMLWTYWSKLVWRLKFPAFFSTCFQLWKKYCVTKYIYWSKLVSPLCTTEINWYDSRSESYQFISVVPKIPYWNYTLQQFMKERKPSSVTFVTLAFHKNLTWKGTLLLFMRERDHSYVTFVAQIFHKSIIWKDTMLQLMVERSHFNVQFVLMVLHKRLTWISMWDLFMKEKSLSCVRCVVQGFQRKVL